MPEFWIHVKVNRDSTRRFRVRQGLIKERGDWTYSLTDTSFFQNIWESEIKSLK